MDEILKIDTIDRYNKLFGFETRHPLVGVVRFDTAESQGNYRMTMGFYSVFLKETRGCRINYGKTGYDFDDQTVVSIAPDRPSAIPISKGFPRSPSDCCFIPTSSAARRSDGKSGNTPFSLTKPTKPCTCRKRSGRSCSTA